MLHKLKNRKQEGFTIIEVLIVLAIAGLIILIVLLAVPALQRNSRNTAMKNDASAVAGGVSSFESNADGKKVAFIDPTGKVCDANPCSATGVSEQAKLQGSTTVNAPLAAAPTAVVTHGTISYWLAHNCAGQSNARAVAIYYSIETTSAESVANNNKCIEA